MINDKAFKAMADLLNATADKAMVNEQHLKQLLDKVEAICMGQYLLAGVLSAHSQQFRQALTAAAKDLLERDEQLTPALRDQARMLLRIGSGPPEGPPPTAKAILQIIQGGKKDPAD